MWNDPFLLEDQLSEDERMIRDAAAAFAADKLAPRIEEAYLEEKTDPAIFREMGEAGPARHHHPGGIWRRSAPATWPTGWSRARSSASIPATAR